MNRRTTSTRRTDSPSDCLWGTSVAGGFKTPQKGNGDEKSQIAGRVSGPGLSAHQPFLREGKKAEFAGIRPRGGTAGYEWSCRGRRPRQHVGRRH
ncbi:MAG: hypothetical protein UT11_C0059G0002 [Berkelbacteria bacterium GW2011_GWA2_38_9]|uniref:Uncharacterized protein n=1 Tax=Berkelbacteria bacterium GW2011_GWA2_38_9 TaxID=1618334 RepID=A0A0G0PCH9_9BACT|nr:MAG: hypothetical protein UT11_C0059G0002 [Berkelbacteria bacterium GW2011_GWA2_38_9]